MSGANAQHTASQAAEDIAYVNACLALRYSVRGVACVMLRVNSRSYLPLSQRPVSHITSLSHSRAEMRVIREAQTSGEASQPAPHLSAPPV